MATYTYEIGQITRSVTSPKGKGNYSYGAQHVFLPTNDIPPFSTINSVTLTHTKTNSTGALRKSIYRSATTDGTIITSTPLTFNVSTVGGSQTARAGKMLYHFSIYTSAQGTGTIFKKSTTSTATRDNVTLTYDYTPPNTIISFFIRNPNTELDESFPFSKVNEISKYTTTANSSYDPSDYSGGNFIPVPFNGSLTSETSATLVIDPNYNYYSGYHPSYWTDGTNQYPIDTNGNTNINWESSDTEKSFTLVFEKNIYTVNFWDNTKNPAVLIESITCEGNTTYSTPAFPQYEAREGYAINTTGWIKDLIYSDNTSYNKIFKENSSTTLYYYSPPTASSTTVGTTSYSVTQYSSFTDLSTIHGDTVNLYFMYIPIRYSINYKSRTSTSSSYTTSTKYRVYGENITILDLTSAKALTTGYKWLNTTPNFWYTTEKTNSTGYSSEGEQITSISSTYVGDVNLFAYQIPIDYTVVRHVYDINGNEIDFNGAEILNCKYGTSYNINDNLTLNTISTTVTCPAIVEESYENRTNDAKYGFNLITDNNINTYTKETFTDTGVAMMKLIIKAKAPCVLTLNISAKCYSTYNRFFISKLDGESLSNLYTVTDSNDLLSYYYNNSSYYSCSPVLKYYISSGTHWLYIKYRRSTTSTSSNYINYNSLSFTTSYEAIRVDKVFLGWYSNPITLSSNFGFPIQKTLASTPTSYLATVLNFQDQLFQNLNLPAITQENDTSFSNLTTVDGTILHYYAYYIPGEQYINYLWLDNYGKKEIYQIPCDSYLYNKTTGKVSIIPNYNKYNEDNVGTINWYYYENNDTTSSQLINNSNTVSSAILGDTYFYGYKEPVTTRTISSQIIDPAFGTVIIKNAKQTYNENDEIFITINPTNYSILMNAYYIEEDYPSIQHLLVGANDKIILEDSNIIIYPQFRSKQVYAPSNYLNVYEGGND